MGEPVMKERPIIFSGEMVKAILDGRKTMTRRLRGLELINAPHYGKLLCDWALSGFISFKNGILKFELQTDVDDSKTFEFKCPYGQPGDRLWVREIFTHYGNCSEGSAPVYAVIKYSADGITLHRGSWKDLDSAPKRDEWRDGRSKTIPSIFMPRWASRITLEITDVRMERLQEISKEDAYKEGIPSRPCEEGPIGEFADLWD
jgi:hypothetical protein